MTAPMEGLQEMIARAGEIADSERSGDLEADATDFRMLQALIIDAFNPRDDDAAIGSILADSIAFAFQYIETDPCECRAFTYQSDYGTEHDVDVCCRCQVLGRVADKREER